MKDKQGPEQQPASNISQEAGDHANQIGQIFGNVSLKTVYYLLSTHSVLLILSIAIIATAGWFYYDSQARRPLPMTGDFNLAVAQFGEIKNGRIETSDLSLQISNAVFNFLDSEYKATDFGLEVQVSQKNIGVITEDAEAEQLAEEINADIVVYGTIYTEQDEAVLRPRFFVAERSDRIDLTAQTAELTGQFQLAVPITFSRASINSLEVLNSDVQSKAGILVSFTEGLVYLADKNFVGADSAFRGAIDQAQNHGDFAGKEVLYLSLGVAKAQQKKFEEALQNFNTALALNKEYARAYLGRGNIYYDRYQHENRNPIKLDLALGEYENALAARDQPAGAYVLDKVNYSFGNIYLAKAQASGEAEFFQKAIEYYQKVIARYDEQSDDERLKELAAHAYFGLGAAHERQSQDAVAIEAYQRSTDLTTDDELKTRAETRLEGIQNPN